MSRLTAEQKENVKVLCELMERDIDAMQVARQYFSVIGDRIDWHEFAYYLDYLNTVGILEVGGYNRDRMTQYRMNHRDILTWGSYKMNAEWGSSNEKAEHALTYGGFEKVGMHKLYFSDIWKHKETGILGRFGWELDNLERKVFSLSPVSEENVALGEVYDPQKTWQ